MSEKYDEIPYKEYRAKVQATTKEDATNSNKIYVQPAATTNRNAQTGFTTNRGSLTANRAVTVTTNKSLQATAKASSGGFNTMQQKLPTEKVLEEFKHQKLERQDEIKQIQSALKELTTSQEKPPAIEVPPPINDKKENLSASSVDKRTFVRCKSDITHRSQGSTTARESARATSRAQQTQRNRSQSSDDTKRKPYQASQAATAQERMRKRLRSQSLVTMNTAQKTAQEKEAIKKRLEELRKNTRKIINKNVQKNKQKSKRQETQYEKEKIVVQPNVEPVMMGNMSFKRPTPRGKKQEVQQTSEEKSPRPVLNEKRIGLLRKPEYKDHSYSALKEDFNKENFVTNHISPVNNKKPLPTTISPSPAEVIAKKNMNGQVNGTPVISIPHLESELTSAGRSPNANIKTEHEIKTDLPYWLRPTSVQIYPYNFIKAVRRKLEAVTAVNQNQNLPICAHAATSISALLEENKSQSSLKPAPPVRSNSCSSSKQLQSIESNFSSISIHLPASNTVSEVSSLASEMHDAQAKVESPAKQVSPRQDDDTTVSSSILSNAEVDINLKKVSPLSLENINKLHIESKVEQVEEKPINFNKFLLDFHESLSQVMQVNKQLKSALEKSHAIYDTKPDENIATTKTTIENEQGEALLTTEYENDLFTKISSSPSAEKVESSEKSSKRKRSIQVLSPASINDSYEKSLRSNSSKTSVENDAAARREKRRELRENLMQTNINMKRGDFQHSKNSFEIETILTEQSPNVTLCNGEREKHLEEKPTCSNAQQADLPEESTSFYDTSLYEKLIQKGVSKEDCVRACLKIREKFILDRTKSQIALLEIQKERLKSKGLLEQIASIKKKQRGILLKMQREREEIQR